MNKYSFKKITYIFNLYLLNIILLELNKKNINNFIFIFTLPFILKRSNILTPYLFNIFYTFYFFNNIISIGFITIFY